MKPLVSPRCRYEMTAAAKDADDVHLKAKAEEK